MSHADVEATSASGLVLVLAPLGRDAEVAGALLADAGLRARPGRVIAEFEHVPLEELSTLVLSEELMAPGMIERLTERLDAQPHWSILPVILLVDPERRQDAEANSLLRMFTERPGILHLHRPMSAESFVSVVRTSVLARQRQFALRDELVAREQAEARARTLADEMRHRVKNAFSIAGSIASHTFQDGTALDAAREAFSGRMNAMARAQDLLAAAPDDTAELGELVRLAIEPYRPGTGRDPFVIEGPRVRMETRTASTIAMGLHELATNAMKYGALSVPAGRVSIRWTVQDEESGTKLLVLEWAESGGPPVKPPAGRGFGSRMLERALALDLGHPNKLEFRPQGVLCTIRAEICGSE